MENNLLTLVDSFRKTALRFPDQIAVKYHEREWNYFDLNNSAHAVAHFLANRSSANNIIICLPRSDWMILAILGTMISGNTYIPIDPSTPRARINQIVDMTNPRLIITDENNASTFAKSEGVILLHQLINGISEEPVLPLKPVHTQDTAYIIFTSGTTGIPKGVPILHKSLFNKITSFNNELSFTTSHNFILLASTAFDASIGQIFLPLIHGSTLHLIDYEDQLNPLYFWDYIAKESINILYTIPSFLNVLLDTPFNFNKITFDYILLGAELFPPALLAKIRSTLKVNKIVNMYGPTEVTVNAIMHVMHGEADTVPESIPIGLPLPGYEILILDDAHETITNGQLGEIAIAGVGLSPGYYNEPTLTNEKFISKKINSEYKRLYLTGDFGRINAARHIEFHGRKDSQIKINGYRIELLEIEKVIKNNPLVKYCFVALKPSHGDQIIAFVEFNESTPPSEPEKILLDSLKEILPAYMIPRSIERVYNFPHVVSGKPDTKKLISMWLKKMKPEKQELKASVTKNKVEHEIIESWKEIFNNDVIGLHDNFMDLGGGSIQSIMLVNKLHRRGIQIKPSDIFFHPTIHELAGVAQWIGENDLLIEQEEIKTQPLQSSKNVAGGIRKDFHVPHLKIEAIGIYLPENSVSTREIIENCSQKINFPLEKLTGIKNRRQAGPEEFSYEINRNAVRRCLETSSLKPSEIGLLICCNTSKTISPTNCLFDPSFAFLLKKEFGLSNAIAFDINNACAGMFTAVEIATVLLHNNAIKNAIVVSGEHITPITKTAQADLENDRFDDRLACLTLGDAGVAITLTQSTDAFGFKLIELLTLGEFSNLCIGTFNIEGRMIMHTDSIKATNMGVVPGIEHAFRSMKSARWKPEMVNQYIMHQTSLTTIKNAVRELNAIAGKTIATDENIILNLQERGNTASNCQFLAFYENIMNGTIKDNSKIVFPVSGSGRTLGTVLYEVDDLPTRLHSKKQPGPSASRVIQDEIDTAGFSVKIESIAIHFPRTLTEARTRTMNRKVALKCLAESDISKDEIELIIFCGVCRDEYITEPAQAAFLSCDLEINSSLNSLGGPSTFCFDVSNGVHGTFNALQIASEYIRSGKIKTALIITSEVNNNKMNGFPAVSAIEMSSGILLKRDGVGDKGIGRFINRSAGSLPLERKIYTRFLDPGVCLTQEILSENPPEETIAQIVQTIKETLMANTLEIHQVHKILLPHTSESLLENIAQKLNIEQRVFYIPEKSNGDLGSSTILHNLNQYMNTSPLSSDHKILIISCGEGITTGGVSYAM